MPRFLRLFHTEEEPVEIERERTYTKHDTDYWGRPALSDKIQERLSAGPSTYQTLRDEALAAGYSIETFYHAIGELKEQGAIEKVGCLVVPIDEYTGADWI